MEKGMPTFRFAGRVLPPFNEFTLVGSVTANWNDPIDPTVSLVMSASLTITKGIVEVLCEPNLFGTENYDGHVQGRANDLASAVVSSYAFGKGMGLSVVLETVVKPDGIKYNIQERLPDLEPLVTVLHSRQDGGIDITAILPIILSDPTIFVALGDLVGSLTRMQDAPVKCGRAVDAIRHSMAPANDRKAGWPAMRENLNISQDFLEYITENSKGPRHGDVKSGTFVEARETIRRSWIVMNRFLEFKKRGDRRLPLSEFPLL
jgi:hypothetical protein